MYLKNWSFTNKKIVILPAQLSFSTLTLLQAGYGDKVNRQTTAILSNYNLYPGTQTAVDIYKIAE